MGGQLNFVSNPPAVVVTKLKQMQMDSPLKWHTMAAWFSVKTKKKGDVEANLTV